MKGRVITLFYLLTVILLFFFLENQRHQNWQNKQQSEINQKTTHFKQNIVVNIDSKKRHRCHLMRHHSLLLRNIR